MSVTELIEAAKRRKKCGPDHGLYDMTILADFAARLLLALDVEAVERRQKAAKWPEPVLLGLKVERTKDNATISAAVIAALGE